MVFPFRVGFIYSESHHILGCFGGVMYAFRDTDLGPFAAGFAGFFALANGNAAGILVCFITSSFRASS
jgi:hypothetical protein